MRKFFQFLLCSILLIPAISCDKSDEPLNEQMPETPENGSTDNSDSGNPVTISPKVDEESTKFIGQWKGRGPGYTTTGVWTFHGDGTYEWFVSNSWGYTKSSYGNWHYVADKNLLITETYLGEQSWNWEIVDYNTTSWTGVQNNGSSGTYTYTKVQKELELSKVKAADYFENGFVINAVISNYNLYGNNIKTGICYAPKSIPNPQNFDDYTKVYASSINIRTVDRTLQSHSDDGEINVPVRNLIADEKYYVSSFIEYEDGSVIHGQYSRLICIKLPEHKTVFMGEDPDNQDFVYLWSTKDLNTDGTLRDPISEQQTSFDISQSNDLTGFDNAINSLGENWILPNSDCVNQISNNQYDHLEFFWPDYQTPLQYYGKSGYYGFKISSMHNDNNLYFCILMRLSDPLIAGGTQDGCQFYLTCDTDKYGKKEYKLIEFKATKYNGNGGSHDLKISFDCKEIPQSMFRYPNILNSPFYCRPVYRAKAVWY